MSGICRRRRKSTGNFVLPLRARFESLNAVFDAILDALVIAGLEMQRIVVRVAAPVAPVQCLGASKKNGCCDWAFLFFCDPASSFVTGQTLYVCGGASIGGLSLT